METKKTIKEFFTCLKKIKKANRRLQYIYKYADKLYDRVRNAKEKFESEAENEMNPSDTYWSYRNNTDWRSADSGCPRRIKQFKEMFDELSERQAVLALTKEKTNRYLLKNIDVFKKHKKIQKEIPKLYADIEREKIKSYWFGKDLSKKFPQRKFLKRKEIFKVVQKRDTSVWEQIDLERTYIIF